HLGLGSPLVLRHPRLKIKGDRRGNHREDLFGHCHHHLRNTHRLAAYDLRGTSGMLYTDLPIETAGSCVTGPSRLPIHVRLSDMKIYIFDQCSKT
ncbi:hypothetical protein CGCVW01_v013462, partial [Colletotrichum viniferum]